MDAIEQGMAATFNRTKRNWNLFTIIGIPNASRF